VTWPRCARAPVRPAAIQVAYPTSIHVGGQRQPRDTARRGHEPQPAPDAPPPSPFAASPPPATLCSPPTHSVRANGSVFSSSGTQHADGRRIGNRT
jgi:hypothetical protein